MPDPVRKPTEAEELDAFAREDFGIAPDAKAPEAAPAPAPSPSASPAAPAVTPPAAAALTAEDWKVKAKLDHDEKEMDALEWLKEQKAKGRLKEVIERDYGFDRRIERAATDAKRETFEYYKSLGYTFKPNPQNPRVLDIFPPAAPAPVAMPTQDAADPLAKEEAELKAKVKLDSVSKNGSDPNDLDRLSEIRAERAKRDVIKEWRAEQKALTDAAAAERAKADKDAAYKQAIDGVTATINKTIEAHATSFAGPKGERWKSLVRERGLSIAHTIGKTEADVIAEVAAFAADLDAERGAASTSALAGRVPPAAPPVLTGSPAGSGKKTLDDKTFDINDDEQMKAAWAEAEGRAV